MNKNTPSIKVSNATLHLPLKGTVNLKGAPARIQKDRGQPVVEAISALSFEISAGEVLGIVGKNGSGKSTLLKMIGGIYQPQIGEVTVNGKVSSMFNLSMGTRNDATGRRNIYLRGYALGLQRKEIALIEPEIIQFSGLDEFIDVPIKYYSQGMKMRLLFAITTSFRAEIILLDEWIGAGDETFRKKSNERMNALVDDAAITVIASHNRKLLSDTCTKIIWLNNGQLVKLGQTKDVLKDYSDSLNLAQKKNQS